LCTVYVVIPEFYAATLGIYSMFAKALFVKENAEKEEKYGKVWIISYHLPWPSKQVYMYIMCDRIMFLSTTTCFISSSREEVESFINYYEDKMGADKTNIDTCLVNVI